MMQIRFERYIKFFPGRNENVKANIPVSFKKNPSILTVPILEKRYLLVLSRRILYWLFKRLRLCVYVQGEKKEGVAFAE